MKIYLTRHAHYLPQYGDDGSITEIGQNQISKLAERFIREGVRFGQVYSSSKIRAVESAQLLCEKMGIEGIVLSEQLVEDMPEEEVSDVVNRMKGFIEDIKKGTGSDSCAIFSHCFAIKYFLNSIKKDPNRRILPHAGVILIDYSGSTPEIMEYDSRTHLQGIETL